MWKQIYSSFMRLCDNFTQSSTSTRKKTLTAAAVVAVLLALAVWYSQRLENNSRVDRNLKALQSQNTAARKSAAEIMDNVQLREEARALEIRENLDIINDDDLPVILRGLLLEYEAERRRAGTAGN